MIDMIEPQDNQRKCARKGCKRKGPANFILCGEMGWFKYLNPGEEAHLECYIDICVDHRLKELKNDK